MSEVLTLKSRHLSLNSINIWGSNPNSTWGSSPPIWGPAHSNQLRLNSINIWGSTDQHLSIKSSYLRLSVDCELRLNFQHLRLKCCWAALEHAPWAYAYRICNEVCPIDQRALQSVGTMVMHPLFSEFLCFDTLIMRPVAVNVSGLIGSIFY